jgi:hypothetical protein
MRSSVGRLEATYRSFMDIDPAMRPEVKTAAVNAAVAQYAQTRLVFLSRFDLSSLTPDQLPLYARSLANLRNFVATESHLSPADRQGFFGQLEQLSLRLRGAVAADSRTTTAEKISLISYVHANALESYALAGHLGRMDARYLASVSASLRSDPALTPELQKVIVPATFQRYHAFLSRPNVHRYCLARGATEAAFQTALADAAAFRAAPGA